MAASRLLRVLSSEKDGGSTDAEVNIFSGLGYGSWRGSKLEITTIYKRKTLGIQMILMNLARVADMIYQMGDKQTTTKVGIRPQTMS